MPQAVLLNAVYEVVIIRALVKKWGQKAFNQEASVYNQITTCSVRHYLYLVRRIVSMKLYYLILISIHTYVSIIEVYQL